MLSIIIPSLNEESYLAECLKAIYASVFVADLEVIVVDGGSIDQTVEIAKRFHVKVLRSKVRSRAIQMNLGSKRANGSQLIFLHSDVLVPKGFDSSINETLQKFEFGCFAYDFRSNSKLLRMMTIPNRKKGRFTGGGDQGFFIRKDAFESLGGFDESFAIMEDFDLKDRALKKGFNYKVVSNRHLKVSARKYEHNAFLRVWVANVIAFIMYTAKIDSRRIAMFYKGILR